MKKIWLKVLENRLHNKVRIELGLEERDNAINYPWTMQWETPDQQRHTLSHGTRVIDKFDKWELGSSLLILGEPGAGKTITLLELARDLIECAEQDFDFPIPVVLPLASWGNAKMRRASIIQKKPSSFEDWLVVEISKYNISKKIVRAWLKNEQLLLLLDGLDEVSVNYQQECVQSLNYFRQKYGQTGIVVCSRVREYESLSQRLNFEAAIYLQPLTVQQIEHFFAQAGSELEAVRVKFQQDKTLQELASPLMLDIIALTYKGVSIENLPANKSVQEYRQHLFNDYIERMFFRHQARHEAGQYKFAKSEVKRWLTWLAQRMLQNSQSIFFVEQMQPELLGFNKWQHRIYCFFSSLIPIVPLSITGYILGVTLQNFGWREAQYLGILSGFTGLYLLFLIKFLLFVCEMKEGILSTRSLRIKDIGLSCGLVSLLIFAIWFFEINHKYNWIKDSSSSYMSQLSYIHSFLYLFLFFNNFVEDKAEIEPEKTSALNIATSSTVLLIASILSGILCGNIIFICRLILISLQTNHELFIHTWNNFILSWKLYLGILEIQNPYSTAAVLKDSLKLFLELGFGVGLFSSFLFIFAFIFSDVNRLILRCILYINRVIPWNYKHFLNYAKESIFLQKVGDGYTFIHRLLLEHFASIKYDRSLADFFFRVEARSYFRSKKLNYVYAEALKLCKKILKENHPVIENNIPELVRFYYQQENLVEGENPTQAAIALLKSLVSRNHHDVVYSLFSLASIYHEQECYSEAESIYRLALKFSRYRMFRMLNRKLKISLEPSILISLGTLCYESNQNDEAKSLLLKALKFNKWLGLKALRFNKWLDKADIIEFKIDDLTVFHILQTLSSIFLEEEQYKKAEDFILQALELRKKLLEEEHPDVLSSFVALARIYESQSRFNEAGILHEKVFEIRLRILGECHLQTIDSLHKLADTYYWQERFSEAETRYLEVIELRKQLLGEDHPDLVLSLYYLGLVYYTQARYQEAELLIVQALEILERQPEEVHSLIVTIREGLDLVRAALNSEQETE